MAEAPRQSNKAKANRKQRRAKEKKPKKFKKFRLFLKIFLLIFLIACLGVLMVFYFKYGDDLLKWKKEAKTIVEQSTKKTFQASETSMIYASNKKMIAKLRGDKDASYINFEDIPQAAIDCMVVIRRQGFL